MNPPNTEPPPEPPCEHTTPQPARTARSELDIIADLARRIKPAELRIFIELAYRRDRATNAIRASIRQLAEWSGLNKSNVIAGIRQLNARGYITSSKGTATCDSNHQINLFQIELMPASNPDESGRKKRPPLPPEWSLFASTPEVLYDHGGSEKRPPLPGNTALTAAAPAVEIDGALLRLIDQILSAKPSNFDRATLDRFHGWLHGYMKQFGRDKDGRPLQNPHPPSSDLVAQFLAVAESHRLERLLTELMKQGKTCESYGWFPIVALSRLQGIDWKRQQQARAMLRDVKRPAPPAPPPPEQLAFLTQIQAAANAKKLR